MTLVQDNSVQAINTALLSINRDIRASTATTAGTTAGLEPGKTYNINISGNAETATTAKTARTATNANHAETATKMSNALTVNGKTYNGSEAVDAGVQTVANGGTGATDAASGFNTLADGVRDSSTPRDDEKMLLKPAGGTWYKTTCLDFWNYIKDKISSVLGLTGKKLTLQGGTVSSNTYADENPKLVFNNVDGSQSISLTFTDFDAVQAPASLTLNGNQGNEYFIAPCIKANNKMRIPIGAPSSLEDGCIWIER